MTEEPNELATIVDAVHGDKKAVLRDQVASIEKEIGKRQLIAVDSAMTIKEELQELKTESLNMTHAEKGLPDAERKDRLSIEKERLSLSRELRAEQRDTWKDVQNLRREEREVEKELATSSREHRRARDLL
jgi:hypothetical protein